MKNLNHFQTRPKVASINVTAYLEKLGLYKELPSYNYLKKLHRTHLIKVPFENMDVHFRRKITLDARKIFVKIIPENRGGFCYENNLLFYHLLVHLGYDCHLISARTLNAQTNEYGSEYDHMAILLKIQNDILLCDVGFGDGIIYPKKLTENVLQMDHNRYYQIVKDPDDNYLLRKTSDGLNFETHYKFTLRLCEPIEFLDMCDYHQSNPQSSFVGKKIMTRLTEEGRITLTDKKLKIIEKGESLEMTVLNEDDFFSKMEEHFGISHRALLQNLD